MSLKAKELKALLRDRIADYVSLPPQTGFQLNTSFDKFLNDPDAVTKSARAADDPEFTNVIITALRDASSSILETYVNGKMVNMSRPCYVPNNNDNNQIADGSGSAAWRLIIAAELELLLGNTDATKATARDAMTLATMALQYAGGFRNFPMTRDKTADMYAHFINLDDASAQMLILQADYLDHVNSGPKSAGPDVLDNLLTTYRQSHPVFAT